jgi:hypothetical protein
MIKKQRITREAVIYRDYPQEGEEVNWKPLMVYGEIDSRLIAIALSIPSWEFAERFVKESKPGKKMKNLGKILEVCDYKGEYFFHKDTGVVLRSWKSYFGGNAQIDPPFGIHRLETKKYEKNPPPATISSKNIDNASAQKNLVLMFRKYVKFLENYYHLKS